MLHRQICFVCTVKSIGGRAETEQIKFELCANCEMCPGTNLRSQWPPPQPLLQSSKSPKSNFSERAWDKSIFVYQPSVLHELPRMFSVIHVLLAKKHIKERKCSPHLFTFKPNSSHGIKDAGGGKSRARVLVVKKYASKCARMRHRKRNRAPSYAPRVCFAYVFYTDRETFCAFVAAHFFPDLTIYFARVKCVMASPLCVPLPPQRAANIINIWPVTSGASILHVSPLLYSGRGGSRHQAGISNKCNWRPAFAWEVGGALWQRRILNNASALSAGCCVF